MTSHGALLSDFTIWQHVGAAFTLSLMVVWPFLLLLMTGALYLCLCGLWDWVARGVAERRARK